MFWVGQSGNVELRSNVVVENNDLHAKVSVVMKNVGSTQLTDVYYMRNADPDQVGVRINEIGAVKCRRVTIFHFNDSSMTGSINGESH